MNILVSHCFLGEPCRYDGQSRLDRQVIELHRAGHNLIPVCPELLGGWMFPGAPPRFSPTAGSSPRTARTSPPPTAPERSGRWRSPERTGVLWPC